MIIFKLNKYFDYMKKKLTSSFTLAEFRSSYWYLKELKVFLKTLGIKSVSKLRKDQIEKILEIYFSTGELKSHIVQKPINSQKKDSENGLSLKQKIINYTNNKQTKDFIYKSAKEIDPHFKKKSGAMYRLNRWRESELIKGNELTYLNLINKYVSLCAIQTPFEKIPHGRYINFLSEYMYHEKNADRKKGIKAWHQLKLLNIPKTYSAWSTRDK